jgi:hypothetical protein
VTANLPLYRRLHLDLATSLVIQAAVIAVVIVRTMMTELYLLGSIVVVLLVVGALLGTARHFRPVAVPQLNRRSTDPGNQMRRTGRDRRAGPRKRDVVVEPAPHMVHNLQGVQANHRVTGYPSTFYLECESVDPDKNGYLRVVIYSNEEKDYETRIPFTMLSDAGFVIKDSAALR